MRGRPAAAYVPLSFAPGEAYQFGLEPRDRRAERVTVTVKVAHDASVS